MARPDPTSTPRLSTLHRSAKLWRALALAAVALAATAVVLALTGADPAVAEILIASALGVGCMVLIGTGLMMLVLPRAGRQPKDNE